jgi:DNA replication ATP-dependent helicase Dna2
MMETKTSDEYTELLVELSEFVRSEKLAAEERLYEIWHKPLQNKLVEGWTQGFTHIERGDDPCTLWAYLDESESRFREGDLLALHLESPIDRLLIRNLSLELEDEKRWLLRSQNHIVFSSDYESGICYVDPDVMDLTPFYDKAIGEISVSEIGRSVLLPILKGQFEPQFDSYDMEDADKMAIAEGFNRKQAEAVGKAVGAEHIACIQGPPGTGKTKVLALIARLLVKRGERVFLTSHTHMAINNALNRVQMQEIPTAKIGRLTQRKGLDNGIICVERMEEWQKRPTNGYVVGATPFATCSRRLENYTFDTVIFDEASQITVPLALMAMRTARKFIFIGDQKQLPPVVLSKSIMEKETLAVFAKLIAKNPDAVMLNETYRMNQWLTEWPSRSYYASKLISSGANRDRCLSVTNPLTGRYAAILDPKKSGIFIATQDTTTRTRSVNEAKLVVELCEAAESAGIELKDIGIVSPFRAQGKAIRALLEKRFGKTTASQVIADTVERMQGQEREMIIISMATGDPVFLAAISGFFFQPERLNVSITRAMTKLVVIGIEPSCVPDSNHPDVNRWITQFRSLIACLTRVEL